MGDETIEPLGKAGIGFDGALGRCIGFHQCTLYETLLGGAYGFGHALAHEAGVAAALLIAQGKDGLAISHMLAHILFYAGIALEESDGYIARRVAVAGSLALPHLIAQGLNALLQLGAVIDVYVAI